MSIRRCERGLIRQKMLDRVWTRMYAFLKNKKKKRAARVMCFRITYLEIRGLILDLGKNNTGIEDYHDYLWI